tara:strand:+ start:111 stop:290 length:180 start_codon:yes stop_codon:yes gene_type:complete
MWVMLGENSSSAMEVIWVYYKKLRRLSAGIHRRQEAANMRDVVVLYKTGILVRRRAGVI